jgi:hypothetical protein
MWAGRRIPFAFWLLPAALVLTGCTHVNPDYRFREGYADQLREQLYSGEFAASARHHDDAQRAEATHLAAYPSTPPGPRLVLSAAPLGERGQSLRVLVEPRDPAGHPARVGTALHVSVLQDTPGGPSTSLSDWDLPADLLEHAWTATWSEAGYRVVLPWKTWPTADRVRVVARLTLADGSHQEVQSEVVLHQPAPAPQHPPGTGEQPPVRQVHSSPADASGVQPADARWEATPLQGSVRIRRPVPLEPGDY